MNADSKTQNREDGTMDDLLNPLTAAIAARDLGAAQTVINEWFRVRNVSAYPCPGTPDAKFHMLQRQFNALRDEIEAASGDANPMTDPRTGTVWTYSSSNGVESYARG